MRTSKMIRPFCRSLLSLALALGSGWPFAAAAAPQYRVEMTTGGYAGSETLANFPVLVRFAEGQPNGFSYAQLKADAADLAFTDESGNPLAFEVDTWDPSGESCVWVKVPTLTATTKIVATWGDPEATTSRGSVWRDAGYAGVWHFTEANGAAVDSSDNGLTAVPNAVSTAAYDSAVVGGARATTGVAGDYYTVADNAALDMGGTFTVSGWYRGAVIANGRLFCRKASWNAASGWEVQWKDPGVQVRGADGAATVVDIKAGDIKTGWHLVTVVFDGTKLGDDGLAPIAVYADGVYKGEARSKPATDTRLALKICSEKGLTGGIDEHRMRQGASSADWIKAEYDTVASSNFVVAGSVTDLAAIDALKIEPDVTDTLGVVSPAFGVRQGLVDGETVDFRAPSEEFDLGDGRYLYYAGYSLYVAQPGEAEELVESNDELSGSYTHVAGKAARLVWHQRIRKGGLSFPTAFASIVSVPGYTADETLRNVQVLFRLAADKPEGFSYADCQPNGADLLFTDAEGHVIPHEIEKWDTAGESLIWVNLPKLTKETTFRFCYGNVEVTAAPNDPCDTWADAGYAGVWHLNEAEASDKAKDATANGNDGTPTGENVSQMVHLEGAVGGARALDTTGVINYFSVPDSDALHMGTKFTVGGWFKGVPVGNGRIFCKKKNWSDANGWEVQWNSVTTATPRGSAADNNGIGQQTTPSINTAWGSIVWVYDGTTVTTYSNGEKVGDSSVTLVVDNAEPVRFGSSKDFKGGYDEVRFISGTLSASRIKADYDTVADAGFLSAGKVVAQADSDTFLVESGDVQRGTVTPDWGLSKNLADGQVVAFSAPETRQETEDPTTGFCFTGYALYVTSGGIEALRERSASVSGSYTHVAGESARLVWFTSDMPQVAVSVTGEGAVAGADFYRLGETVTLRATPAEGMRFKRWVGELPAGVSATAAEISFIVDRVYRLEAVFEEKPVCAAFFSWKGHGEGEAVTIKTAANDLGTETFVASSVNARKTGGRLPAFSKHHPAKVIYSDAGRNDVLTTDPGSIYFTSDAADLRSAGGDILFDNFGTWISQQKSCTLEFFVRTEVYQQYASAWAMILSGETQIFFAADAGEGQLAFSVEKSKTGTTGRAKPTDGETSFLSEAWQHVALVYDRDAQKVTCYRNYGAGAEKSLVITETTDNVPLCLGSQHVNADSNFFNGWISCLRLTKGALEPEQFMRAGASDSATDTLAVWDFRNRGEAKVGTLKPLVGDADLFVGCPAVAATAPAFANDVPGAALYANAAAFEAQLPLSKRVGAIAFPGDKADHLVFSSLSSALSDCDDYTLEFFVKPEATASWKAAVSWNDTATKYNAKPNEVQVPGKNAKAVTVQCNASGQSGHIEKVSNMADGAWHHVAVTYAKATDLYTLVYDRDSSVTISARGKRAYTAAGLLLGTMLNNLAGERFVGKLSCLRVSKRALQPSEFMVAGPKPPIGFTILIR